MQENKRRFNSMDFLLVMVLVAAVLSLILQGNLARSIGLEDVGEPCECTLLLTSLDSESAALFRAGEPLTHPDTGEVLGTIRTVRRENAVLYTLDEQGRVRQVSDTASFNLTVILSATGKTGEHGFLLNGAINASPGDTLPITPNEETEFSALVLPTKAAD